MITVLHAPASGPGRIVIIGAFVCFFIAYSFGQKREYKEAQLFVTAKAGPQQLLLTNRGFTAFEPVATAFINPDGKVAVVILTLRDSSEIMQLWVDGKAVRYLSPPNAIITMIL